ncbi:hypothetical protein VPH35_043251 [Triticum aestivum]
MERVDGGAGLGARGSAGAMLGTEMHLVHQPQPQILAASSFQQPPEHLHHANGGFQVQHHQAMLMGQHTRHHRVGAAGCSWSRMKWMDAMVRLLIAVVYNAGDDGEGVSAGGKAAASHSHGKVVASAVAHGGHGPHATTHQRKGKWRSMSWAMVEKGCKRCKRVVELLGRGTACNLVTNPALLDTMGELTAKAREEARKMLRSKRLLFREMCNCHNPGGPATSSHGTEGGRQVVNEDSEDDVLSSKEAEEEEDDHDLDNVEEKAPGTKRRDGRVDDSNGFHNYGGHKDKRRGGESSAAAAGEDGEENRNNKPARGMPCTMQKLKRELAAAEAGGYQQQLRQWVQRRALELEKQELAYEVQEYALERHHHKQKEFDLDHLPGAQTPPPGAAIQQQPGSSPSTTGHPN